MKTIKLPNAIVIALGQYYIDRNKQIKTSTQWVKGPDGKTQIVYLACKGERWDKEASLKRISDACHKHKYGYEAVAGTFWFSNLTWSAKLCYEVDETSWPLARVKK